MLWITSASIEKILWFFSFNLNMTKYKLKGFIMLCYACVSMICLPWLGWIFFSIGFHLSICFALFSILYHCSLMILACDLPLSHCPCMGCFSVYADPMKWCQICSFFYFLTTLMYLNYLFLELFFKATWILQLLDVEILASALISLIIKEVYMFSLYLLFLDSNLDFSTNISLSSKI